MSTSLQHFPYTLARHSFSPRDVARAGDVWRAFQDVAVHASSLGGWPPERYRTEKVAFVVRAMTVVHHCETTYGETLEARTWISRLRKGMLCTREVRLVGGNGPVASATQEWVHVSDALEIAPIPPSLVDAFPVHHEASTVAPPSFDAAKGPASRFELECWHTWMDPLGHVNHPAYVDWCDEALARHVASRGIDPVRLTAVGEHVSYRTAVTAPERVVVETRPVGVVENAVAFTHEIRCGAELRGRATTLRRLVGDVSGEFARACEVS